MTSESGFRPEAGPMSPGELKEHARGASTLDMELYLQNPDYRFAMARALAGALGEEPKEIEADGERLEEFFASPDSQAEIERFAQMKKLRFDQFNSDRLFRLLVRTYNPRFQEIFSRELVFAIAKVLDWAQPLGLTADQIEAIAEMAPKGTKELLEGTAAGEHLKTKRAVQRTGKEKEGRVMAVFEELKRQYLGGEKKPRDFSREVKQNTEEILRGERPGAFPASLREEYAELQRQFEENKLSPEEFSMALEALIDRNLPQKSSENNRVQ